MKLKNSPVLRLLLISIFLPAGFLWAKNSPSFKENLRAFQKNSLNLELRKKVIQDALALKSKPALPKAAVRLKDEAGEDLQQFKFKEAALALQKAADLAPWDARTYLDLAQAREKESFYPEAIQSLNLYLLAAPGAADSPSIQDRISKLEDVNKKWMMDQINHLDVESVTASLMARLAEMGPSAQVEVPFLAKALKSNDVDTRANAAVLLGGTGPVASGAVTVLGDRLNDPDPRVRGNAAVALSKVGPDALQVLPDLTEALKDDEVNVRIGASCALGNMGPAAAGAVPALIKALKDRDPKVRGNAAYALGQIGPSARAALPALGSLSNDPDPIAKKNAAWAVQQLNRMAS